MPQTKPFSAGSIDAARQHALLWNYATRKPAVILLERDGLLHVLIGPHKEFLDGRWIVLMLDENGKEHTL